MKIAATYEKETGNVFQHFKTYQIEDGKIVSSEVIDNGGKGNFIPWEKLQVFFKSNLK